MEYIPTKELLDTEFENLSKRVLGTQVGISSGYEVFDKSLGGAGFEPANLYVVGSRPNIGKTLVAVNILLNQIKILAANEVLVYISTSASATVLMQRILATAFNIEISKIQNGDLSLEEYKVMQEGPTIAALENGLVLCESEQPTISDLKNLIDSLVKAGKSIKFLTIDTLQGVKTDGGLNREQGINQMLKEVKLIATQLQFPVLLTSEVSRRVEYREGPKIPQLKDLKDSRLIADRVDFVYFVLRPMYYEMPEEEEIVADDMHLICKKNKYGPLDLVELKVDLKKQKIMFAPNFNTYSKTEIF